MTANKSWCTTRKCLKATWHEEWQCGAHAYSVRQHRQGGSDWRIQIAIRF